MKAQPSFLLLIAVIITLVQGCKMERINPQCPTITGLQPSAAGASEIVSVKGKNFYTGLPELYKILIGDKTVDVLDVPDSTTLRFKVPAGIGSGAVSVAFANGSSCNSSQTVNFTYYYTGTSVSTFFAQPLSSPQGLDLDNLGNLVVADIGNFQIRVIELSTGNLKRTIGKGGQGTGCDGDSIKTSEAHFFARDIDVDLVGNIFIAEPQRSVIRWIAPQTPDLVKVYAGKCNVPGNSPDTVHRLSARLTNPYSVFRDEVSNSLYFTDELGIRKIFNSVVHFLRRKPYPDAPYLGVEVNRSRIDMGPVFVAYPVSGLTAAIRGNIVSVNELGIAKSFEKDILISPIALTLDSRGNIFVADIVANRIFVIYTNGVLKVLAGTGVSGDNNLPVPGLQANFKRPAGIALAEKDGVVSWVYVSDSGNNKLKAIKIE